MMARQSAAQSGKRGFQASLRSTFRRGRQARQITTMRAIRQEGPPPDLGGEEPKKLPLRLGMRRGSLMTADRFLVFTSSAQVRRGSPRGRPFSHDASPGAWPSSRSEEHTSDLQSLSRISYAVFRLNTK